MYTHTSRLLKTPKDVHRTTNFSSACQRILGPGSSCTACHSPVHSELRHCPQREKLDGLCKCWSKNIHSPSWVVLFFPIASASLLLGFFPPPLIVFVPDLPSDTSYWLEAVGGGFQLCISKDFQRTGTSSYGKHCSSCNSFHLTGDSANVYRAPTVCQALYWAYTHCFLHLFIL